MNKNLFNTYKNATKNYMDQNTSTYYANNLEPVNTSKFDSQGYSKFQ